MPLGIDVADPKVWAGVALRYWQLDIYFLPVCEWTEDVPPTPGSDNKPPALESDKPEPHTQESEKPAVEAAEDSAPTQGS